MRQRNETGCSFKQSRVNVAGAIGHNHVLSLVLSMDEFSPAASCLISTRIRHRVATVTVRDDVLIWVRKGVKTLIRAGEENEIRTGEAVVLARGTQWDVINDPAQHGRYEAFVLQFGEGAIQAFHASYRATFLSQPIADCFNLSVTPDFEQILLRVADAIASPDTSGVLRNHRVIEVLLMLAELGCVIKSPEELTWPDRIRRLIAQRPHAEWTVGSLASACHVSSSTLRRRLSELNLTVGNLVREVRLETALVLLQSTSLPVGDIAQRCGYESHSRFSAAFRVRYGFLPSKLTESS